MTGFFNKPRKADGFQPPLRSALCDFASMKNRFTHESKTSRGRIRKEIKESVYERDGNRCQYCFKPFDRSQLTIDHLVPLASGGLDEITNYVTCCLDCNQSKADKPLAEFARSLGIEVERLPVHGDPVIDNADLPIEIRILRKRIYDHSRSKNRPIGGKSAQKKIEKQYRRAFWETPEGMALEDQFPDLPGQVRVMIPEIQTIAGDTASFVLLLELAKSAKTRNLIGTILTKDKDVVKIVEAMTAKTNDEQLKKRIQQAWQRFGREMSRLGRSNPGVT